MIQAVEDSLRRLKTDHIDIYFAHLDDGVTPIEEIARGFDETRKSGQNPLRRSLELSRVASSYGRTDC